MEEATKILLADDDEQIVRMYKSGFRNAGFETVEARNGKEVYDFLEQNLPDIILLDLVLPGIDGFEILETIKDNDEWKDIPVIVLSNFGRPTDEERSMKGGATKFLVKANNSLDHIVSEIRDTLGK